MPRPAIAAVTALTIRGIVANTNPLLYSRIPVPRFNKVTANENIATAAKIMMA